MKSNIFKNKKDGTFSSESFREREQGKVKQLVGTHAKNISPPFGLPSYGGKHLERTHMRLDCFLKGDKYEESWAVINSVDEILNWPIGIPSTKRMEERYLNTS